MLFSAFLVFTLLTACPREALPDQSLEGTSWVLLKFSLSDGSLLEPQEGKPITLAFRADQASGSAGCNSYFAPYEYGPKGGQLKFDGIGATEKYCEGLMKQEKQYLDILEQANAYIIRTGQLEISGPGGKLLFKTEGDSQPKQDP